MKKKSVNAALVYFILEYYKEYLDGGGYISDGQRNILHETHFQEYLVKYFEFRYAYCKLNVVYRPVIRLIVWILFPFRNLIKQNKTGIMRKIYGILKMEEIVKEQEHERQ